MSIVIPTAAYSRVQTFLSLSPDQLTSVLEALKKSKTATKPTDLFHEISSAAKIDEDAGTEVGQLLMNWYSLHSSSQSSLSSFIDELVDAANESNDSRLKDGWNERRKVLEELLLLEKPLGIAAKVMQLSNDAFRLFLRGNIISDARPIFSADASGNPEAFVVLHTLQIKSRERTTAKDWYFTMDYDDLVALKATLDRAIRKHESLKIFFSQTNSHVIE